MIHPIQSLTARHQANVIAHYEKSAHGRKLEQYKGIHKGQICFVLGNGPSLCAEDLDRLAKNNIVTFATNRVYNIFPQTTWRPTYYVCEDPVILRGKEKEVGAVEARAKFMPIELAWHHDIDLPEAIYFHANYKPETVNTWGFSENLAKEICCGGTVTFTCMQLAAYMGFSEIYLLGVDHDFQVIIDENRNIVTNPGIKDYFCEGYDADIKEEVVHDLGMTTITYKRARAYCDAHPGIMIYNATRGGRLEVFERIDFDRVIKKAESAKADLPDEGVEL